MEAIFAARTPEGVCVDYYPSLIAPIDAPSVPGIIYCPRETRPELDWQRVWADAGVAATIW